MLGKQRIILLGTFWASLTSGTLLAYGPCDDDEAKYCDQNTHQETVKACLHKRIDELTPGCRDFVKSQEDSWSKVKSSWNQVKIACESSIKNLCSRLDQDTMDKMKAVQVCLMSDAKSLDKACKKDLNRHIHDHQPNIKELP